MKSRAPPRKRSAATAATSARTTLERRTRVDGSAKPPQAVKVRKSIQSVEIGGRVLLALMESPHRDMQLKHVAEQAGMSRSQAHRYLLSYINLGLVAQDEASGHYSLGPLALKIGLAALARLEPVNQANDALGGLVKLTGYAGHITIWGDYGPTLIRWIEGSAPILASVHLGSVLPLQNSSAGMIYLAFSPPLKTAALLRKERERGEGANSARLAAAIEQVRRQGYAMTDDQVVRGLVAITAPVFDLQGWPAATLGLLAQSGDPVFSSRQNIEHVVSAARRASVNNGWPEVFGPAILRMT
jgi:DNA-binding IclR family transcriptional regulator